MNFIHSWPKPLIAFVFISIGIVFILLNKPPYSICDSQIALFKEQTTGLLFIDERSKKMSGSQAKSRMSKSSELCDKRKSLGSCYTYFSQLNVFLKEFKTLSSDCKVKVFQIKEVKKEIFLAASLMTRIAWGENPPKNNRKKFGWLKLHDITLFCNLKNKAKRYAPQLWKQTSEDFLKTLPYAENLEHHVAWELMLPSLSCRQ